MIYISKCDNSVVTDFYLNNIANMFNINNDRIIILEEDKIKKTNDIFIVATVLEFIKIYLKGNRKIVYWMQGLEAEESFLKHHNIVRKIILNYLTKFALKHSLAIFYVSKEMKLYQEHKFNINTEKKCFVMPCFNTSFDKLIFKNLDKKFNNFVYVGSLSEWQCFSETLEFYKKIENLYPDSKLFIYTFEKDKAIEILKLKGIKNFVVDCVSPDKIIDKLSNIKFGFVLRSDIPINNVATPTKLSTYMAAGVIPIFSECLKDFFHQTKHLEYVVSVKTFDSIPYKLIKFINSKIDYSKLIKEYNLFTYEYYNPKFYSEIYKEKIRKIIEGE